MLLASPGGVSPMAGPGSSLTRSSVCVWMRGETVMCACMPECKRVCVCTRACVHVCVCVRPLTQ